MVAAGPVWNVITAGCWSVFALARFEPRIDVRIKTVVNEAGSWSGDCQVGGCELVGDVAMSRCRDKVSGICSVWRRTHLTHHLGDDIYRQGERHN